MSEFNPTDMALAILSASKRSEFALGHADPTSQERLAQKDKTAFLNRSIKQIEMPEADACECAPRLLPPVYPAVLQAGLLA